jgi:hypothetical protein
MIVDWAGAIKDENLAKITIGGEEFTGIGYQGLLTVNTKTYVEEPKRTNDGSMPNIDDHETFIVPRCTVNFKFFNIKDYQRLCRVLNSANQFPVEYFDKQFGQRRTYMMYAEPEEMAKIYNIGTSLIGVLDYEVSFIGTLNNLQTFKVKYVPKYLNGKTEVQLEPKSIDFSTTTEYTKGQVIYWQNNYYEAIYYKDTFKDVPTTNTEHWVEKVAKEWAFEDNYVLGDLVSVTSQNNGQTVVKYYEAIKEKFFGYMPTNREYWQEVTISAYSSEKTYQKGNYAYVMEGSIKKIFKAIFYNDKFVGKLPDETEYWTKIAQQIDIEKDVNWGTSINILKGSDLSNYYKIPEGKTFKGWNTVIDGSGLNILPNSNWSVFETTNIYPIIS